MLPKVHTFAHHPALVRDIGCYCWGAMQLKLGGIRSLLSAVGDRLSLCRVRGTLPKFQNVKNALGEAFEKSLERAKWKLWHGKAHDALTKLAFLRDNIIDEEKRSKITGLHDYIERNQSYIVNYDERDNAHKPYTSQVAESHVDTLIK